MIKPILLFLLLTAICAAGPVTVSEFNSGAACTNWSVTGIGTSAVSFTADGEIPCTTFVGNTWPLSLELLDLTAYLSTDGPQRPGYLLVTGFCEGGEGGLSGGVVALGFGGPGGVSCTGGLNFSLPITLGTAFSVTIHGSGAANCPNPVGTCTSSGWDTQFEVEAFDAALGFFPPPNDPGFFLTISGVPEPASGDFVFVGLTFLFALSLLHTITARR